MRQLTSILESSISEHMNKLNVKRIRGALSQAEFAERLGIPVKTIQGWEQGRHAPNAAAVALLRLAESGVLKKLKR
jgi:DNA-binding transcriptional regulator YiaG